MRASFAAISGDNGYPNQYKPNGMLKRSHSAMFRVALLSMVFLPKPARIIAKSMCGFTASQSIVPWK